MDTKTMEDKNENENRAVTHEDNSSNVGKQAPKGAGSPVSAGVIIAALIAGYALGYFPPKRVAAEPSSPSVSAPAPVVAPAAPVQRAPAPSGGGCGV